MRPNDDFLVDAGALDGTFAAPDGRRFPTASQGAVMTEPPAADPWSQHVTETSDAMELKHDVFKLEDPNAIARSLKSSAEHSDRRKTDPYRSAMSMLTFYINRAGKNLPSADHRRLEAAKDALRELFGRAAASRRGR